MFGFEFVFFVGELTALATAGIVSLVVSAISATTQAVMQYQQSKASAKEAEFNAEVAENNAEEAAREASHLRQQGEWEKRKLALETLEKMGKAKTGYAASGVALGSGTAATYEADIRDAYTLDLRQLDYDISERVRAADVQRMGYLNQASLYKSNARNMRSAGKTQLYTGIFLGAPATTLNQFTTQYAAGVYNDLGTTKAPAPAGNGAASGALSKV